MAVLSRSRKACDPERGAHARRRGDPVRTTEAAAIDSVVRPEVWTVSGVVTLAASTLASRTGPAERLQATVGVLVVTVAAGPRPDTRV
jgi:hypothetical protein